MHNHDDGGGCGDDDDSDICDSNMSSQFQTEIMIERRTMTFPKFLVNLLKLYIGIFMLNTP